MTNNLVNQQTNVGLVQINNSFSGQNYLPLSIGMLQAYAQQSLQKVDDYKFMLPLYRRLPVREAVNHLEGAEVAFFSTYVWNYRISLEIAKALKNQAPDTLIVFGGPQVPDKVEPFLRENPFVDIASHGEGELTATTILENYDGRAWENVPGISYLDPSSNLVQNPKASRMKELFDFPSPYLTGVFSPLMEANPNESWIALWETNRGCPFSCTFCDWGSAVQSKVYSFEIDRLYQEIEWFAQHEIEFVFCCDANFGILPRDLDIVEFIASVKRKSGYPHAMSVQNTKNATERAYSVQKILFDAGLNKGVDIALQSTDPTTLKDIKRANISSESYQELQSRFARDGIETYTDLILGLPGETYDTFADGVSTIIANGQHNRIQFSNLSVLPNAEMGDPEYQRRYGMALIESKTVNMHGSLAATPDEILQTQFLVIATETMPKDAWIRSRVFAWTAALLHFDKTLQIPLILLHNLCSISYREMIEKFLQAPEETYPVLCHIRQFFDEHALGIQCGRPEYVRSEEWLNIWWPADEYTLIRLCAEGRLGEFYKEAENLLIDLLREKSLRAPEGTLNDAVRLNQSLIKLPFQSEDAYLTLSYNVWEFYRSALTSPDTPLQQAESRYHIDRTSHAWNSWNDWCREVIWYGNKRGATSRPRTRLVRRCRRVCWLDAFFLSIIEEVHPTGICRNNIQSAAGPMGAGIYY